MIVEQNTFFPDLTNLMWSQIDQTLMANCLGRYFGFGQTNLFWEASIRLLSPHNGAIETYIYGEKIEIKNKLF